MVLRRLAKGWVDWGADNLIGDNVIVGALGRILCLVCCWFDGRMKRESG